MERSELMGELDKLVFDISPDEDTSRITGILGKLFPRITVVNSLRWETTNALLGLHPVEFHTADQVVYLDFDGGRWEVYRSFADKWLATVGKRVFNGDDYGCDNPRVVVVRTHDFYEKSPDELNEM